MRSTPPAGQPGLFQFGCLFAAIALGLIGAGMVHWAWNGTSTSSSIQWPGLRDILAPGTARAEGIVVRSGSFSMPASGGGVYPIVQFEVDGKRYEIKGVARESEYAAPGTHLSVVYPPNDPAKGHIAGAGQIVPAIMLGGGGSILVLAAVLALAFGIRRSPPQSPVT